MTALSTSPDPVINLGDTEVRLKETWPNYHLNAYNISQNIHFSATIRDSVFDLVHPSMLRHEDRW